MVAAALDLPSHRKACITCSAGEMDELPGELIDADLDSLPDTVLDGTSVESVPCQHHTTAAAVDGLPSDSDDCNDGDSDVQMVHMNPAGVTMPELVDLCILDDLPESDGFPGAESDDAPASDADSVDLPLDLLTAHHTGDADDFAIYFSRPRIAPFVRDLGGRAHMSFDIFLVVVAERTSS